MLDQNRIFEFLETNSLSQTVEQCALYSRYFDYLLHINESINLTRITEDQDVLNKHLFDALVYQRCGIKLSGRILDLGSGCGVPGIIIAISQPDISMTLLDSIGKKVDFLNACCKELGLNNCHAIKTRAEDLAKTIRKEAKYDTATIRAVGSLKQIIHWSQPLLKESGHIIAWKQEDCGGEINEAQATMKKLKLSISGQYHYTQPIGEKRYQLINLVAH